MYIIQFKSCQSFYRIVKTLAVYDVIMNDKRISSLWPRVYHSSFSDILVLHSDFTLTLQLWYRTLTCIQFTTSVFTMATTRLCFCLVPTHIPPCLSGTHSLLMFCDLSVNCLINVSCDLPISFKDIYINTSLYIFPVVLWCFVIMFYLWPFRGQTMEFVTNCPVLLILYVDIINNYNKTTVHNVVLSFWYSFNFGHLWHWQGNTTHDNTTLANLVKIKIWSDNIDIENS